jgi:hypothetical protein
VGRAWLLTGEGVVNLERLAQVLDQMNQAEQDSVGSVAWELREFAKVRNRPPIQHDDLVELLDRLPSLSKISATDSDDLRTRFDTIDKEIIAAVERLAYHARAGISKDVPSVGSAISNEQVNQLKLVLGLTAETGRQIWGERQRAAAAACGISPDTFRRRYQADLLHNLAIELLDNSRTREEQPEALNLDELIVFVSQPQLEKWLVPIVHAEPPATAQMVLLSCASFQGVLRALRDVSCDIEMLLCHPDRAITAWQERHIRVSVEAMRNIGFEDYDQLSILFYQVPASMRAWRIGNFVGLGWYTYKDDVSLAVHDTEQRALFGHDNIMIVGDSRSDAGRALSVWFDREFASLKRHRLTSPDDVLFPKRAQTD